MRIKYPGRTIISIVVAFLCLYSELTGLPKFINYKTKAGLPSNMIYSCIRDEQGFIWIGTENGLCRYDGVSFRTVPIGKGSPYSLEEKVITGFFQYTKDILFLLSMNGRVISYDYSDGMFKDAATKLSYLRERQISSVFRDRKSRIWFTTERGLIKTSERLGFLAEYIISDTIEGPLNSNRVNSIYEDRRGMFWLAMFYRGLMRFDPGKGEFKQNEFREIIGNIQVRQISGNNSTDTLYIATNGEGLIKINYKSLKHTKLKFSNKGSIRFPSDQVNSIVFQSDSCLWLGTRDGLIKMNIRSGVFQLMQHHPEKPYTLANDNINSLFTDNQNLLWIATSGGFSKLDLLPERFIKINHTGDNENSLRSNIVNFIIEDNKKNIWFGTSKGVSIYNKVTRNYFHYDIPKDHSYLANEEMVSAFSKKEGEIWLGTWGGGVVRCNFSKDFVPGDQIKFKNFYSDTSNPTSLSSNFVRSIVADDEKNIYISTWNGGLNIISASETGNQRINFRRIKESGNPNSGLASNYISNMVFDRSGNFWVITSGGLQKINFKQKKYSLYPVKKDSAESLINKPTAMINDSRSRIWYGTFGGLVLINRPEADKPEPEIIYENSERGIYSLIEDYTGKIWFSTTNSEIGVYDPEKRTSKFFQMSEEVDGFDFYFGSPCLTSEGTIYFNGNSGCLKFNPKYVPDNSYIPPVYLTSIKVNGTEYGSNCDISRLKEIKLDYEDRNLVISFAALNFRHSDNNAYKYILEQHNKSWISIGKSREINFANLSYGEYLLKIMGSNNDGLWNNKPAVLKIIIQPPVWANNYYRTLAILITLTILYWIFNGKLKNLRREKELQNNFSRQLIESQEDERRRLSKELHDSIGQNLLVVINRIKMYATSGRSDQEELSEISEILSESIAEVREISSNLHPHQLERLGLKKAIISMINKISKSSHIEISTDIDDVEDITAKEREINIYRIIQEALNNIIKHSNASKAFIGIKSEGNSFLIVIKDNGQGFDVKNIFERETESGGLGLKSIQERANLLQAKITINSSSSGTEIILRINR